MVAGQPSHSPRYRHSVCQGALEVSRKNRIQAGVTGCRRGTSRKSFSGFADSISASPRTTPVMWPHPRQLPSQRSSLPWVRDSQRRASPHSRHWEPDTASVVSSLLDSRPPSFALEPHRFRGTRIPVSTVAIARLLRRMERVLDRLLLMLFPLYPMADSHRRTSKFGRTLTDDG